MTPARPTRREESRCVRASGVPSSCYADWLLLPATERETMYRGPWASMDKAHEASSLLRPLPPRHRRQAAEAGHSQKPEQGVGA
ncbi:hypothetical protein NDU88_006507 [Pleurodeles waltl]|uniref:Uncharacterized protein n=1 Tax=Pleurodeles waltl TaxID=8319 RepID=A0AAV7QLB8_PLEWA|nr:hypothetical protein NDU88_006507 [Pleurodeles waltl]